MCTHITSSLTIHLLMDIGCFIWTLGCMYIFELEFIFSKYIPRSGIAESIAFLFLAFLRNLHIVFHSGYTNLHSHKQCPWFSFLHILTNICYLWSFWWQLSWQVWGNASLWFCFTFLWWQSIVLFLLLLSWHLKNGPVVRTLSSHFQGPEFNPWSGN